MVNLKGKHDQEYKGRSPIDPWWAAEKQREEQAAMFDGIINDFINTDREYATVVDIDTDEAVIGLQAAITRLGLDDDVEAWLDEDDEPPRAMLERM